MNVENAIALLLPHGKAQAPEVARRLGLSPAKPCPTPFVGGADIRKCVAKSPMRSCEASPCRRGFIHFQDCLVARLRGRQCIHQCVQALDRKGARCNSQRITATGVIIGQPLNRATAMPPGGRLWWRKPSHRSLNLHQFSSHGLRCCRGQPSAGPPVQIAGRHGCRPAIARCMSSLLAPSAVNGWAEHFCSAQVFQMSTCSAIASASSTSMPRHLTASSILVWPSKSWTVAAAIHDNTRLRKSRSLHGRRWSAE